MKKLQKKVLAACLVLVLAVTALAPMTAETVKAATKRNYTMYVGEALTWTDYGTVKSVKSSKKSVVKASKNSDYKYKINLTAKKKGKAKVTVKTSYGTTVLNITVKKADISVGISDMGSGYYLLSVTNDTKQTFEEIYLTYTLRDSNGNIVESDTTYVTNVVGGTTAYDYVYVGSTISVDLDQSGAKVSKLFHDPSYTYTNQKKNLKVSEQEDDEYLQVTFTNQSKKVHLYGKAYILWYDAEGNVVYLSREYISLSEGATDTASVLIPTYMEWDDYKIVTSVYSYKSN